MTYIMKLHLQPFNMIKSGRKIYELRLNDLKRQKIKVGDFIVFISIECNQTIAVEVLDLLTFANFEQLYNQLPLSQIGYETDYGSWRDMLKYYSLEAQSAGVLAIKIKVVATNILEPYVACALNYNKQKLTWLLEQVELASSDQEKIAIFNANLE